MFKTCTWYTFINTYQITSMQKINNKKVQKSIKQINNFLQTIKMIKTKHSKFTTLFSPQKKIYIHTVNKLVKISLLNKTSCKLKRIFAFSVLIAKISSSKRYMTWAQKINPANTFFFSLDFHFNVEIRFCVMIFNCLHLGKKYLLKAHTKNPNISFLKSCLKVPNVPKLVPRNIPIQCPQSAKISSAKISSLKVQK